MAFVHVILILTQIRNVEGKTAFEVCGEPEAKAELQKWEAMAGLRYKLRVKFIKDEILTIAVPFFIIRSMESVDGHNYGEESSGEEGESA